MFVNKHVSFQSNHFDSFINVFNIANLNISNQSSFESHVVSKSEITYDFVDVLLFVFVSIFEIELNAAHQWFSRSISLTNNHLTITIIFNIFDTFLSSSFIDIVSSFFDENLFSQITITLQNSFERARREVRQQIKNVYSYDSIINQIIKSFFNDAFSTKTFNHLLFYLSFTVYTQISTSTIKKIKQKRDIDKSRDRSRESDVEKNILRSWIFLLLQTILERQISAKNYLFYNTMCINSRT